ncbi:MAG: hypothetical protein M1829_001939 [Trizodia sp. TS-e1964]|nr:MAG: hypothetical protein M1829_001939 [Trizodia sp. TS-e1964]
MIPAPPLSPTYWPGLSWRQSTGDLPTGAYAGDKSPAVLGVLISNIIVNVISLALRLWARKSRRVALQWDDYFMIMDMIINFAVWALIFTLVKLGLGKHIQVFDPENLPQYLKVLYALSILYLTGITLVKLSVLFLYRRIFPQPAFQRLVWITVGLVASYGIVSVLIAANLCFPFDHLWNQNVCFDQVKFIYGTTAFNTALDILIFALPIPLLWKLHVPRGKKAALISIFLVGLGVCFLSIARILFIKDFNDPDVTYASVTYVILADYEILFSVCCANFSVAYPVIAKSFQRVYETVSTQKHSVSATQNSQPVLANTAGSRTTRLSSNNKEWHELRDSNSDIYNTAQWQGGRHAGVNANRTRGDDESGNVDAIKVETDIEWQSVTNA